MDLKHMLVDLRDWGLSQSEIARRVKSTQATIWRIENGKTDPRASLAKEIEKLYRAEKKKSH